MPVKPIAQQVLNIKLYLCNQSLQVFNKTNRLGAIFNVGGHLYEISHKMNSPLVCLCFWLHCHYRKKGHIITINKVFTFVYLMCIVCMSFASFLYHFYKQKKQGIKPCSLLNLYIFLSTLCLEVVFRWFFFYH